MKKLITRIGAVLFVVLGIYTFAGCDNNSGEKEPDKPDTNQTYKVTWVDQNGKVLEVDENVKAGDMPEYNSAIPTKISDKTYEYQFRSWYPVVIPASGDVTYVADYSPKRIPKAGGANWYEDSITWVMQNKNRFLSGVSGGGAICTAFNKLFTVLGVDELVSMDPLDEIKGKIDDLQQSVDEGFYDVERMIINTTAKLSSELKEEINKAERNIESTVLSQTAIANKGESFDSLLTTMKATERSIQAILDDGTILKRDKALSIARLIGSYDKWGESSNLFASYLSFLDAITLSTYSTTGDKILFDLVYDQQNLHSLFSTEAIARGAAYVEKVVYLAFYAYSILQECISAATTVANFTADDINQLNDTNKTLYASIVSPYSVIKTQSDYLSSKLIEIGFKDKSVMDIIAQYFDVTRHGGIVHNETGQKLGDTFNVKNFNSSQYQNGNQALGAIEDFKDDKAFYDVTEAMKLVNHVKSYYNMTLREFFTMIGYDLTSVPTGAYYMIDLDYDSPHFNHVYYSGVNIDDESLNVVTGIVVYDSTGKTGNTTAISFK